MHIVAYNSVYPMLIYSHGSGVGTYGDVLRSTETFHNTNAFYGLGSLGYMY